jgi:hypothetical protein
MRSKEPNQLAGGEVVDSMCLPVGRHWSGAAQPDRSGNP